MARTYKTLSLSLPPEVVVELEAIGKSTARTAARVAAEIVLRKVAEHASSSAKKRRRSWCCHGAVLPIRAQIVLPEKLDMGRTWVPAIIFLCGLCRKQLHEYNEYEGWITDD